MSNEPTTPAPSLTGEEVSRAAKQVALELRGHHWTVVAERIQRLLSTARAQDKAALAKKDETIARLRRDFQDAEAAVSNVLRLLPNRKTDSWEDAVNGWLKETAAFRAENERLTKYGAGLLLAVEGYAGIKEELEKEVARLKAEVESYRDAVFHCMLLSPKQSQQLNSNNANEFITSAADQTRIERDDLRTRLADAEHIADQVRCASCGGSIKPVMDGMFGIEQAIAERDEARTRLAQAEKQIQDERLSRTVTWNNIVSEHEAARHLAEQNATAYQMQLEDAEQRGRDLDDQVGYWRRISEDHAAARTTLESTIETIRLASSCPAGTDLAAWVAQLAEDKRRLESLFALGDVHAGGRSKSSFHWWGENDARTDFRSAIDVSNPKTE